MKIQKTNAVRLLEQAGITCVLKTYAVDEKDLSGVAVAAKIGLPPPRFTKHL
jgi:Cys-tRNA(Pro)/Cys-tRNA(Cys) deacylase